MNSPKHSFSRIHVNGSCPLNAVEIEEAITNLAEQNFDEETFPFAFLEAFGNKDTTIKRLKSGATNASDIAGGVLQRNNIHLAVSPVGDVTNTLSKLRASPTTHKAKAKFVLATDGVVLEAEDLLSGETIACEYQDFPNHFGFFLPLAGITTVKQRLEQARQQASKPLPLPEVYRRIWRGSYPSMALDDTLPRDLFYNAYLQTYLQRDVRDLTRVGDERAFLLFLRAAAARTGQLLNYADLARDVDIDQKTAKAWLSILETSGIVYLLQPYHNNVTKRLLKTPKLYFLDTGLCAYLTQWSSPETLEAGAMSGAILENWLLVEILKSWLHNGQTPAVYFYRDKEQREIDLLIERDNTLYPVEFKKTASPNMGAAKHFTVLEKLDKQAGHGAVICLRETDVPLSREVDAIPAGYL